MWKVVWWRRRVPERDLGSVRHIVSEVGRGGNRLRDG